MSYNLDLFEHIELLHTNPFKTASVYKVKYNEEVLVLKELIPWNNLPKHSIVHAYEKCVPLLIDESCFVKVKEVIFKGSKIFVIMEYLNDYINCLKYLETNAKTVPSETKRHIFLKIMESLMILGNHKITNTDFGYVNFMIHPTTLDVKMIDLDYLVLTNSISDTERFIITDRF